MSPRLAVAKTLSCDSCGTTLFLEDQAVRLAGIQGVLHEIPSLVALGEKVRLGRFVLRPIGLVRFSYGRGTWDEYWCEQGAGGQGVWLSVDEGELVVQAALDTTQARLPLRGRPSLGQTFHWEGASWRVTEFEMATCLGWKGELPEVLAVGKSHDFVNCSAGERLLSGEFDADGTAHWFLGEWVDAYDLRRGVA
ncbi:hypothetical protein GCM10007315_32360 [Gemmobacter tilapiae]|uniref:DUF4178 domain-containing protein n=1 Tax=Neogemmobacter tilapiae TaxID=875041 RepID=A0A918TVH7_9RHOB|nr:hypothetical protein GCM10007315_32360 [Gemmobacter tilapiae]